MSSAATLTLSLPELLFEILAYLPIYDICQARQVNIQWREIIDKSKGLLWSSIPEEIKAVPTRKGKTAITDAIAQNDDSSKLTLKLCLPLIDSIKMIVTCDKSLELANSTIEIDDHSIELTTLGTIPVFTDGIITKFRLHCKQTRAWVPFSRDIGYVINISDPTGIRVGTIIEICQQFVRRDVYSIGWNAEDRAAFKIELKKLRIDEKKGKAWGDAFLKQIVMPLSRRSGIDDL